MKNSANDRLSRFLSLILRHHPEAANITVDEHGWADVKDLIRGVNDTGRKLDRALLEEIVRTDQKGRYSFNEDKTLIRANQGHSILVDVELEKKVPPDILYHGTATRFLGSIRKEGLKPMGRLYVHLSKEEETAKKVGERHGIPVVLKIDAKKMHENGEVFYLSSNGVWLVKSVAACYINE